MFANTRPQSQGISLNVRVLEVHNAQFNFNRHALCLEQSICEYAFMAEPIVGPYHEVLLQLVMHASATTV